MAFTYDITTNRGKLRFKLGDTDAASFAFEDDEIDYLLSSTSSQDDALIEGVKVLIAQYARRVKVFSVEGLSYNDTKVVDHLRGWLADLGGTVDNVSQVGIVLPNLQPHDSGYDITTA